MNGKGASSCNLCKVGTFKPTGATDNKCRSCPAGYETGSTQAGASVCTQCAAGKFSATPNTALCTPCPKAYFAANPGQKACKACPAGQITDATGGAAADGTSASSCTKCGARRFRPSMYAANTCTLCPKGRETKLASGAAACTACIPGSTLLTTSDLNCTACAAGEYADKQGFSGACKKCPKGYAVPDEGNSACDICGPGTYQDEAGQLECKDCPVGTYTEMTGSTELESCLPAPKGNYAPGTGNDGFIPCEGGTYQDEEGQGACKPCPPGYQCPAGSVAPTKCARGFYADMKQPWCKECAKGTYQDNEGQRACKPCPAGSYCQATKMVTPTPCPAGKFGVKFSSITPNDCAACPINVSDLSRQPACPPPCLLLWRLLMLPACLPALCSAPLQTPPAHPACCHCSPPAAVLLCHPRPEQVRQVQHRPVDRPQDGPEAVLGQHQEPAHQQVSGVPPGGVSWQQASAASQPHLAASIAESRTCSVLPVGASRPCSCSLLHFLLLPSLLRHYDSTFVLIIHSSQSLFDRLPSEISCKSIPSQMIMQL